MVAPTAPDSVSTPLRPWREVLAAPWPLTRTLPILLGFLAFAWIFADPMQGLAKAWWNDPDAGHGLLLFPVSLWLAWQAGLRQDTRSNVLLGSAILVAAVLFRALGGLAAEFFTQRFAIWMALVGVVVFVWGFRQALHWWLPITLLALAIPLPATITNSLAVPLQFQASRLGTALIEWREIPVQLSGNVITIPGQRLFVAEACSGLRSLTALISLGVLIGGMWLTTLPGRAMVLLLAIPVAIAVNAVRIFLTAFLMHFVSPEMGTGFMHKTEGWALFVLALGMLAGLAIMVRWVERRYVSWRARA
jgi:exosortase